MIQILGAALPVLSDVLKRVLPDEEARAKAEMEMARMVQEGHFKELEVQMSAIVAEAKSGDPWTSRARPSFLYVVYFYLLAAVPMGFMFAFMPGEAAAVTEGVKGWFTAIPGEMWTLFGVGYLGYTGARSYDKRKILDAGGRK